MSEDNRDLPSFQIVEARESTLPPAQYAPEAPGALDQEEEGLNIRRYFAAVFRYKWLILLVAFLGTTVGVLLARRVPPTYVANATIWIESSSSRDNSGPIRSDELLESTSWIDLLRSYVVLDQVVEQERLYLNTERPADSVYLAGFTLADRFQPGSYQVLVNRPDRSFVLETQDGSKVQTGTFGDSVGAKLGFRWVPDLSSFPSDRAMAFSVSVPRDVSVSLLNRLRTQLGGNFLRIRLTGVDPAQTASILNAMTKRFVDVARDLKRAKMDTLVSILGEQLSYSERNLRQAETALQDFRVNTITLPSDRSTPVAPGLEITQNPVLQRYFSQKLELEQIRHDEDAISQAIDQARTQPLAVEALEVIQSVQQSSELTGALDELTKKRATLRTLRYQYTADYPEVKQLAAEIQTLEKQTIPHLAQALLDELSNREAQLHQTVNSASSELQKIPARAIEEARLRRRVEIASNLYTTLQARYESARLGAASSIPDIRILDSAAIPQRPESDEKQRVVMMAFLASLGLGIAGAILRDRMDPRFRYPEQVTGDLGLNILGGIPNIGKKPKKADLTRAREAFRAVRLNLTHAHGAAGPVTMTVTSPGPGDGKSFVAANLALSFADLGQNVLLVDGDVRRGSLHHMFDMERKPGLTDYLVGRLPADRLVRKTSHTALSVVTSGSRLSSGPELVASPAMRELLLGARRDYDVVIVDSPPLAAGVDPFIESTLTGGMVLVMRTGSTNRELAESKMELFDRLPVRLLGAVLNGVPDNREYRYYSYMPGYAIESDQAEDQPVMVEG